MKSSGAGGKKANGKDPGGNALARRKRIRQIQAMLEKGTYRVNAKQVAEKMVEDAVRAIRSRYGSG